jgi:putative nucleotidyltransferase with HDIG domain
MKAVFERIWRLALLYQDKRDDKGHAKTVLNFALRLVKKEKADENVVIPAAILHDIGWSQLPKEERLSIFVKETTMKVATSLRIKHEASGVKMTRNILEGVKYDSGLTEEILEIVSRHDTRVGFISKNEGVVRDADKLWRFSKTGFWVDVKRSGVNPECLRQKLKAQIDEKNFFYSETAKGLAIQELEKRRKEFKIQCV